MINRNWIRLGIALWTLTVLLTGLVSRQHIAMAQESFVLVNSKYDFGTTLTNIKKQIAANKLALLKEYNVQTMLKMVGMNSDRSVTLATFHPRYGKVIYNSDKNAVSAVPLRLIVQERGGDVIVAYIRPSVVLAQFEVPTDLKTELDSLLEAIVTNATK